MQYVLLNTYASQLSKKQIVCFKIADINHVDFVKLDSMPIMY